MMKITLSFLLLKFLDNLFESHHSNRLRTLHLINTHIYTARIETNQPSILSKDSLKPPSSDNDRWSESHTVCFDKWDALTDVDLKKSAVE